MATDDSTAELLRFLDQLNAIGIALSTEQDHARLLEMILEGARAITNADGGTLYSKTEDDCLRFEIVLSETLKLRMGGTSGTPVPFDALPLYDAEGQPNNHMVAAWAALSGKTFNIPDAYASEEFDFSGTRAFDHHTGYRSRSFLTVPMRNHENELIGVLQLINCVDPDTGEVGSFSRLHQHLVESLASQAAVAITNRSLIDAQRELFDAFIQLIANAIDEKSPYTAGHCRRVPVLTNLLAEAACSTRVGLLKDFHMSDEERYELNVAAWLHDCGKITTPEYVVDKSTKLQTIFDRIHLVDARFEVLRREEIIAALRRRLERLGAETDPDGDEELQQRLQTLEADQELIRRSNVGGEVMSEEQRQRIRAVAARRWRNGDGVDGPLLSEEEVDNLCIGRGTLNGRERAVINNHVAVTIKMLESLPYPRHLRRVPEYAGGHHEKMDGSGYPRGLTREQMSIPARMMAIADVFEALTAKDRPYKQGMKLSQALAILGRMRLDGHVDGDLFDVFIREKVYLRYAREHLSAEQIDEVEESLIPGYTPPSGIAGC